MIDVTLCTNTDCPVRKRCVRGLDVGKGAGQRWAFFEPAQVNGSVRCSGFWDRNAERERMRFVRVGDA